MTTVQHKLTQDKYTVISNVIIDSFQHYVLENQKTKTTVNVSVERFNSKFEPAKR